MCKPTNGDPNRRPFHTQKFMLLVLVFVCAGGARGQETGQETGRTTLGERMQGRVKAVNEDVPAKIKLMKQRGRVLGEGNNQAPVGRLRLKTYRIEELTLAAPMLVETQGRQFLVDKAWRLTITGGPFPVRAAPALIWVDNQPAGIGIESPDLNSISVVTFDRDLIKHGSTISMSYGEHDDDRVELPEKVDLTRLP